MNQTLAAPKRIQRNPRNAARSTGTGQLPSTTARLAEENSTRISDSNRKTGCLALDSGPQTRRAHWQGHQGMKTETQRGINHGRRQLRALRSATCEGARTMVVERVQAGSACGRAKCEKRPVTDVPEHSGAHCSAAPALAGAVAAQISSTHSSIRSLSGLIMVFQWSPYPCLFRREVCGKGLNMPPGHLGMFLPKGWQARGMKHPKMPAGQCSTRHKRRILRLRGQGVTPLPS